MSTEHYLIDVKKILESFKGKISDKERDFAYNVKAIENWDRKEFQEWMPNIKNETLSARIREFRRRKQQDKARGKHMLRKNCEELRRKIESLQQEKDFLCLEIKRFLLLIQRKLLRLEISFYHNRISLYGIKHLQ